MEVLEDVQNNYKNKLRQLNYFGTKKKVIQLKFEIFQDWIKYLQEENKLLAQLVIDLEDDVIKDVQSLKKNSLDSTPTSVSPESSDKVYQSEDGCIEINKYKSDLRNLLVFLKAIRQNKADTIDLSFYFVRREDLYGSPPVKYSLKTDDKQINHLKQQKENLEDKNEDLQRELQQKEQTLQEHESKILELEQKLIDQEKLHREEMQRRKDVSDSFEKLLSAKQSSVWEASKEVTNNMIQIWDKLVDKKVCEDRSSSNCHVVMDRSDSALDSLQQAVNLITKELQTQGTISKQSQGDALLFIVFDKNKNCS